MLASSIVRHRPVRDYSCCVLDSAFCFRDSSLPAPVVMPSRRDFFNPAEAYVMTLGDGQSKKRVIQLLNQISRFFGAADLHAMEWQMLTYDHVLAFRETRVRSGLSPATINLQLSVIKMTCKQCWLKNLMPLQTYAAIKEVKSVRGGRVPKGRALKPAESGRLLKTTEADGDIRSKRDAAIIALALGCGLRRSEIASLLLEQVDHVRQLHDLPLEGPVALVQQDDEQIGIGLSVFQDLRDVVGAGRLFQQIGRQILECLGLDLPQQVVLVLVVGVERAAVHVGGVAERLHGYLGDMVFAHEVHERLAERPLGVLHASVRPVCPPVVFGHARVRLLSRNDSHYTTILRKCGAGGFVG